MAEDAGNSRDPSKVAMAYTIDSTWRNRWEFINGRDAIEVFLETKWKRELDYRLIKEVWAYQDNRIAVRFAYEWHDRDDHPGLSDCGLWLDDIASCNSSKIAASKVRS